VVESKCDVNICVFMYHNKNIFNNTMTRLSLSVSSLHKSVISVTYNLCFFQFTVNVVFIYSFSSNGPIYAFDALDTFCDILVANKLHPGFELMGNPSNIFTDFENRTQVYWWRDLVSQLASRYISKQL
jgi:hypothetical protein